jgi:hypothetical protein
MLSFLKRTCNTTQQIQRELERNQGRPEDLLLTRNPSHKKAANIG